MSDQHVMDVDTASSHTLFRTGSTGHSTLKKPNALQRLRRRFNVARSTEDRFADNSEKPRFTGAFGHIRKKLDYEYHSHYRKERQWFHDSIIENIMENTNCSTVCDLPQEPWLILSCGAYGAGKHFTIHNLIESGRLPLLSFVYVDPDEIRRVLPEYRSFCEDAPTMVENLTQKECGYVSETLTLAALQSGRNVILDGSLQDANWYKSYIRRLKQDFPGLRVGIIQVTAEPDTVLRRSRIRSIETDRFVSESAIKKSLQSIPEQVAKVSKEADAVFVIRNEDMPELEGKDWDEFSSFFGQTPILNHSNRRRSSSAAQIQASAAMLKRSSSRRRFSVLQSSEENHRADHMEFYGKYAHIRETLDYTYHANYSFERQRFQDSIISEYMDTAVIMDRNGEVCTTPTEPWIVFTAGAMGAGKSYTMRKLVEGGHFPLMAFVSVDPDDIRRQLPEFHLYVDQCRELAGELTRKEAGFIAEILTLAGLEAGKNVLVDGSLRDAKWYQSYFHRLREEFPLLRLAILHVTAPRCAVIRRAADRAISTGRLVPMELLVSALEQVPISVKELAPLADYCVELNNAPDTENIELVSDTETWTSFASNWIQTCAWVPNREKMLKKRHYANQKLTKVTA